MQQRVRWCVAGAVGLMSTQAWAFPNVKGEYVPVGGVEAHQKVVTAVVEETAKGFNFFVRGIARKRLVETNPVFGVIQVDYKAPRLTMSSGDASLELVGTKLEKHPFTTPKGEEVMVDQLIYDKSAKRVFYSNTGRREVVYTINDTLDVLTLEISVHSKYLSTPLSYALQYRLNASK